jgi:adenylate cyclase
MQVYGRACRGVAHIVARRLTSAIQDLSDALSFARLRKAGLEAEPRILADLANAYRLNGDVSTALTTADEAIAVAIERHARIPECLARVTRADLLLRSSGEHRETEGKLEIARSKALMQTTGAVLFNRFINEVEADHTIVPQASNDRTALF